MNFKVTIQGLVNLRRVIETITKFILTLIFSAKLDFYLNISYDSLD